MGYRGDRLLKHKFMGYYTLENYIKDPDRQIYFFFF